MIRIATKGERLMRKLVLAFLLTVPVASGQNSPPPVSVAKPDRTLTLLGRYEVIGERKSFCVAVVEHNITSHAIAAGRDIQPMSWYHMKVLRDGQPAPQKIMLKKYLEPRPAGSVYSGSVMFETIPPKGLLSFDVHLEMYFDLSAPGRDEITFDNGIETSNTLIGWVTEQGRPIEFQ
jgi:hypothetical protein